MDAQTNRPKTELVHGVARTILWPITRFFDPRFRGLAAQLSVSHDDLAQRIAETAGQGRRLEERVGQVEEQLAHLRESSAELDRLARADMEMTTDATTLMGEALADVARVGSETLELVSRTHPPENAIAAYIEQFADGSADDLEPSLARLLNYAESHRGFAAQRGLWFNPPVSLSYEDGTVAVGAVNERVVELPYVLRALARVPAGGTVLDVGASESLVSILLASLGYDVTAIDPRPYPLSHPRLEIVTGEVQHWEPPRTFDAVICLSTIEHIGLGAYGEKEGGERADLQAMKRIRDCTAPGGILVLTTPFGTAQTDSFTRVYDRSGLDELLGGWQIEDLTIATREGATTWIVDDEAANADEAVALVIATPQDG
jgi:SAM-dependent methyltransferase